MIKQNLSLSLLLAIALGFSACGGGGATPQVKPKGEETNTTAADTEGPVFLNNIRSTYTIAEGTVQDIATIEVTDASSVTFELMGKDADFFELTDINDENGKYSATLRFKQLPDYETQPNYTVTVLATDSANNSTQKTFTIYLGDKPFAFDIAGNLGAVEENKTIELPLMTVEAKDKVSYEIKGDKQFSIKDGKLIFKAPYFNLTDPSKNEYSAEIKADDTDREITLKVTAQVIKKGGVPVLKTYLLKHKEEIENNIKTIYDYKYDANNYLIEIDKDGTNVYGKDITTFEYDDDYKIMRGYGIRGLKSIRVFENKNSSKMKFAAMVNTRLCIDDYKTLMAYIEDTASFQKNRHLVKYIHGLEFAQTKAEIYIYNNDDTLSRMMTGTYTISSDEIVHMSNAELHSITQPSGGFPDGSIKLNKTQVRKLNSGTMPFSISQETTFVYNNGELTQRNFYGYYDEAVDASFPVTVAYFSNSNIIREISSDGVTITYNNESMLDSVNTYKYDYKYSDNGLSLTVTVRKGNTVVTTYKFEEE